MNELDAALERFSETDCVYGQDEPNYGPMAASALEALGHASLTTGFLDIYMPRLPAFTPGPALPRSDWAAALGDRSRAPGLVAAMEIELERSKLRELVAEWMAQRIEQPAAATNELHALVRLGYAIENLAREETAARKREAAFALGFAWAAGAHASAAKIVPAAAPAGAQLTAASQANAALYLANPSARNHAALGITLPAALRAIVAEQDEQRAAGLVARCLAGLQDHLASLGASTGAEAVEDPEVQRVAEDEREIRYRAACSVQEHAIVTAESALREARFAPDAKLFNVAADAALRLSPPGYREWR